MEDFRLLPPQYPAGPDKFPDQPDRPVGGIRAVRNQFSAAQTLCAPVLKFRLVPVDQVVKIDLLPVHLLADRQDYGGNPTRLQVADLNHAQRTRPVLLHKHPSYGPRPDTAGGSSVFQLCIQH